MTRRRRKYAPDRTGLWIYAILLWPFAAGAAFLAFLAEKAQRARWRRDAVGRGC